MSSSIEHECFHEVFDPPSCKIEFLNKYATFVWCEIESLRDLIDRF